MQQQGNGGDQSHQLYNIYTADEESPTDPFSIDDQASFLISPYNLIIILTKY